MAFMIPGAKKTKKKSKAVAKLSATEKENNRKKKSLHTKVLNTFKNMGFEYLKTDNIKIKFDGLEGELDNVFLFKNIILIVEETIEKGSDHLKKKIVFWDKLRPDFKTFIKWLKETFDESFNKFDEFSEKEYKIFYLYATPHSIEDEKKETYPTIRFLDAPILNYFNEVSKAIKHTSKYELFKFLDLDLSDIDHARSR
ncbi:hypothetical protein [Spirosoma sp. KUDC1026]|uniref:hypothetical protein n=1 Tax=Spirosoma sp. KUDC1026 TaxID=2745947 RepID=UPI00159BEF4E|nr:hypothetical protein [Spirosoma sp. KUDC1026]QKZ15913.1 hypothetical protein HU175_24510 [Spirosoma sp. KUDC1026]